MANIISYKLMEYSSSCPECYKKKGIIMNTCSSRLHDFKFPEFLSIIFEFTDLNDQSKGDYQILKQNLDYIKSLYCSKLEIPQVNITYYLKAIIYMDGPAHFTITLYKIDQEVNNLKKNVSYYHDGTRNGGYIVPIDENEENLMTDYRYPYILIFRKY